MGWLAVIFICLETNSEREIVSPKAPVTFRPSALAAYGRGRYPLSEAGLREGERDLGKAF
jgi:hypothetical protein